MRHYFLVGRDAKFRKNSALVRHVVNHIGVEVGIDRAYPLVHERTVASSLRLQWWFLECFIYVGRDSTGFVDGEIAMLQDRHTIERMQREVCRLAHLGLKIPKRVRHALVREDEPDNVNIGTVRKTKHDGVGHDPSPFSLVSWFVA